MHKDTFFTKKTSLNARGRLIELDKPAVMGIINITPDSFYAESRKNTVDDALAQAEKMLIEGALFLDIGAYSSRPGAANISVQEETDRLAPIVEAITQTFAQAIVSVDTFRARVAESAVRAGAHIINDISGGQLDADMFATVARLKVPYILMHMKGNPQTMHSLAQYDDVFDEVFDYFVKKTTELTRLGAADIILDPGFGFAKNAIHNYSLLNRLDGFATIGMPVLAGMSRKRMIYGQLGTTAAEALNGTTVLNTIALTKGAGILRVHDVKQAAEAIKLWQLTQGM